MSAEIEDCVGFDENVVLAIKTCFYDYDMRCELGFKFFLPGLGTGSRKTT